MFVVMLKLEVVYEMTITNNHLKWEEIGNYVGCEWTYPSAHDSSTITQQLNCFFGGLCAI